MSNVRGIFRLKQVYEEQLSGNWSVKSDVWLSPSPYYGSWDYGYFFGGGPSFYGQTSADRIDFSNDTATATLKSGIFDTNSGTKQWGAASSSAASYLAGGYYPENTDIRKFNLVNETSSVLTTASLATPAPGSYYVAGTGNQNFGYFSSGESVTTTVTRVDYSNDTSTSVGNLSFSSRRSTATGNQSYGYFAGGVTVSSVSRIDYSNDTATA